MTTKVIIEVTEDHGEDVMLEIFWIDEFGVRNGLQSETMLPVGIKHEVYIHQHASLNIFTKERK